MAEEGKKSSKSKRGGIATLSDLAAARVPEEDSDSDGGPQEYYTGGEKSGMMVQDPNNRHNRGGRREIDSIFDRAKQHGAQQGAVEDRRPPASSASFTGTGRTVSGSVSAQSREGREDAAAPEPVFHTITFWRNGFTIDDGPLRTLDDPANTPLLQSIRNGECPRELEPSNRNIPVHVNLVRREEDWQAPKEPKYRAFQGAGRTLGTTSAAVTPTATPSLGAAAEPFRGVVVDEQKPFTSLQLRLADGTRMVARFNHTHTVSDIRGFINAARSDAPRSYVLQAMGFPPKELSEPSQTIEAAGLVNAVVIQKLL